VVDWKLISGTFWIIESVVGIFTANIIPFFFLKKYGFISILVMQMTTYLIWRILWPVIYFR